IRFRLVKLRTMAIDAEARRAELLAQSKDPGWLHLEHDPRITRVGRLQRLGARAPRPDSGDHRAVAGPRSHEHPLRGDGQAGLPVRDELVVVERRALDPAHVAGGAAAK